MKTVINVIIYPRLLNCPVLSFSCISFTIAASQPGNLLLSKQKLSHFQSNAVRPSDSVMLPSSIFSVIVPHCRTDVPASNTRFWNNCMSSQEKQGICKGEKLWVQVSWLERGWHPRAEVEGKSLGRNAAWLVMKVVSWQPLWSSYCNWNRLLLCPYLMSNQIENMTQWQSVIFF